MSLYRPVLIDAWNLAEFKDRLIAKFSKPAALNGFDIETFDRPHPGILAFRKNKPTRCFDLRRTIVTGFSLYQDEDEEAYYFNLHHADVNRRLTWTDVKPILDAIPADAAIICHNASYERTMMRESLKYELPDNVFCSMQLAVSCYGPDEYDLNRFVNNGLGDIAKLLPKASRLFHDFEPRSEMNSEQGELFAQVVGKETDASWSYNGVVKSVAYGYGLKDAVRSFFGFEMPTFEQTLNGRNDMGDLTGPETFEYGCSDSYWAVQLFKRLLQYASQECPEALVAYQQTENPCVQLYSEMWSGGMRLNKEAVVDRISQERAETAKVLRTMKAAVSAMLPFESALDDRLAKRESWYVKSGERYRERIRDWATTPDSVDDYDQILQVSGSVSKSVEAETGNPHRSELNLTYWSTIRTLVYDLLKCPLIVQKGKVQSDDETRGKILDRLHKENPKRPHAITIVECLNQLAGIEQRTKLYLTPYMLLVDPETGRVYPQVTSMLATRRTACQNPNGQQLAKRGYSTYVRGFFEADEDDEVQVSSDLSQIELVLIGEFSGDPEFRKAYGQLPYKDLHLGAAASGLSVTIPEMNLDLFKSLARASMDDILAVNPMILTNIKGERMDPPKAYKYWRTEIGKGSNFNYWYSGALSTVGQRLGWSSDQMWEATDRYRQLFAVAEAWRKNTIDGVVATGVVKLPDGHRRVRFEATHQWAHMMREYFGAYHNQGIARFGEEVIRAINTRAKNQAVNALIQGTCATLIKRSMLRIRSEVIKLGLRARVKLPIHDEILASVHFEDAMEYIKLVRRVMTDHADIIKTLPMDCTVSIGNTFEPFDAKKAPYGQIELDEAPDFLGLPPGARLDDAQVETVISYLRDTHDRMAA